ncbi:cell division cycle protein 27 homolog B isoform X2 [Euphorbia lathyris]|uniref:cell division cycle protein 27 homolog B isoform X2 n=1 Tax=Euphorbia lathyris TaxID=212925 RepID=UPI003313B193
MEAILVKSVENSLTQFLLKNAIFLCERLCAEFPSEVNLQLLARCYLNNNQAYCAYHILKGTEEPQSRYLFAFSCFQMDLLSEAEAALVPGNQPDSEVPNGASGHYLLGLIYRYTDRKENSVKHLKKALSIDPLFWTAYEELCMLGAAEEAAAVFSRAAVSHVQKYYFGHESKYLHTIYEDQSSGDARNLVLENENVNLKYLQEHNLRDISQDFHETAVPAVQPGNPSRKLSVNSTPSAMLTQVWGRLFSDSGPRRSPRLAAMRAKSNVLQLEGDGRCVSSSAKSNSSSFGSSVVCREQNSGTCLDACDDASSHHTTTSYASSLGSDRFLEHERENMKLSGLAEDGAKIISGISDALSLLSLLGEGYRLLCLYRCEESLEVYQKLSHKQYNTGWVLSQVGRTYYELVDYMNAEYAFRLSHQYFPYNLEGMDIYSSVLYHLQEEMKLSHLAQELISIDRLAPQSWCTIGNCYSLQKDHETAIKSFSRAIHLNSRHAYAFTLLGHECSALEEYENGVKCFQRALSVDSRHYSAWYGLGLIYLRQEKLEFAQHHFQNAFYINPRSSVILCYIGITLHELKRDEEALEVMEKAILADERNPLPLYQKAKILVSLEKFDEALKVLEELKEYVPHESCIYAMIGKIYEQQQKYDAAIFHFGLALDLNPNALDAATMKAAMENLLLNCRIHDDL